MFRIRDISIKNKLVLIQIFTCTIVLVLCCAAFVVSDVDSYKENKVQALSAIAQVIGSNSISSLEFLDNVTAKEILADLRVRPDVINASILDKNGQVFAAYVKQGSKVYPFSFHEAIAMKFHFKEGNLFVYHKIVKRGEVMGVVCMEANVSQLNDVVRQKVQIAGLVLVFGIGLAFIIAIQLQKYISKPLFNLVEVMQKVSDNRDYKSRASVEGKDEIAILSLVFNEMLTQIAKRDNALSEKNNLLNSILQSMGDGVIVADKNGKFILRNPAVNTISGLDAMNAEGEHINKIFLPDKTTPFRSKELPMARAIKGEELNNFEMFIKDGGITEGFFLNVTARPLKDQLGEVIGGVAVLHNITEQKKMEETLRITRQQLQDMIDNSTAVIFAKRPNGKYIFVNSQYETLFHVSREKIVEMTDYELFSKEYADQVTANDKQVLETGQSITFEEKMPLDDGIHTYVAVKFPMRDVSGNPYAVCGMATDITDRKRIEVELADSLALLRATLESTADGILVVNKEGKINGFNQKFLDIWKIPDSVIATKDDNQAIAFVLDQLKDPENFLSKVRELYAYPENESFDTLEFIDGRIFERYSKPQISREEIIGRVWSFRDITERRRAEEADKKRVAQMIRFQEILLDLTSLDIQLPLKEKLRKIVEISAKTIDVERTGIWFYDETRSFISSENIYLLSNNDYIPGNTFYREKYPRYFRALEVYAVIDAHDVLNDPRTAELNESYLKPFGIVSMMDVPMRLGGNVIGVICHEHVGSPRVWTYEEQVFASSIAGIIALALENSERKKAEESIRASEEKYRFLAEMVPQFFWTALPSGELDYFNTKVYDYSGRSFSELMGWGWECIIHPDDAEKTFIVWKESLQTGNAYQSEFRVLRKDGTYRWHLTRALPLKDKNGSILKWFGTTMDIHEQKIFSEKLKLKNEELMRSNNDLDNFIYTASHDLKAPIANIEGLLNTLQETLREETPSEGEISQILTMMTRSIKIFKKVLFDLTEITKAQKSSLEEVEENNFSQILEEVKSSIDSLIETSGVSINADFKLCPTIKFSRKNLRSIIYNLLSNAIKYRSPERAPVVAVKAERKDEYIVLSVRDNGMGMPSGNIEKIFSMFKRLHSHVEGTGVGLYIVKRIITNAGGKIEVESEVGKGSLFKVYFKG